MLIGENEKKGGEETGSDTLTQRPKGIGRISYKSHNKPFLNPSPQILVKQEYGWKGKDQTTYSVTNTEGKTSEMNEEKEGTIYRE